MTTKAILTVDSTITCSHPAPGLGGKLELMAKQQVLTIDGKAVLVDSLVMTPISPGCSQTNTDTAEVPCATVASQNKTPSTVLRVNGLYVLLHETSGNSAEGKPTSDWSSTDPKQDVLKAD